MKEPILAPSFPDQSPMNLLSAPRQPFVGLALAAVTGIIVADILPHPSLVLLLLLAIGALVVSVWPSSFMTYTLVGIGFFWMHSLHLTNSPGSQLLARLGPSPDAITATGTIISEPKVAPNGLTSFLLHLDTTLAGTPVKVTLPDWPI